jgi:hypothetical protein
LLCFVIVFLFLNMNIQTQKHKNIQKAIGWKHSIILSSLWDCICSLIVFCINWTNSFFFNQIHRWHVCMQLPLYECFRRSAVRDFYIQKPLLKAKLMEREKEISEEVSLSTEVHAHTHTHTKHTKHTNSFCQIIRTSYQIAIFSVCSVDVECWVENERVDKETKEDRNIRTQPKPQETKGLIEFYKLNNPLLKCRFPINFFSDFCKKRASSVSQRKNGPSTVWIFFLCMHFIEIAHFCFIFFYLANEGIQWEVFEFV